jgi:pimeloyl-ACP methyl ester carboxylesterase
VPPFPGWEGTPPASREGYRPSALARWAESLVDGPFALVGFSWGGTVGLRIARERLRAVVLVDVGYQSPRDEPVPTWDELLEEYADDELGPAEMLAAANEGFLLEPAAEGLDNVRGLPVLLLAATVPHVERREADLASFAERLPQAEIHRVEGAEHNVLGTAPEAALPLVFDFLRRALEPRLERG